MLLLETDRLILADVEPEQLPELLEVFLSQTDYLELTELTAGERGLYDLSKLRRDWHIAQITPGRHMLGIYVKPSQAAVGVMDFMAESPSDGMPWLGLLLIHGAHQGRGLAAEALQALLAHGREEGWRVLRAGVLAANQAGLGFARRMGFREVGSGRETGGERGAEVVILELAVEEQR